MSAETSRARRLRRDLRFLRVYSLTTMRVMRYPAHPESVSASEEPLAIADRIEEGLAGEARRYRAVRRWIIAAIVGPVLLSGVLWSGMYWVPWSIYWWPFERGNYGLPFFSLFEWLAYLMIAAYFVITWALLTASRAETRKLGTEYRRLLEVPAEQRADIAAALEDGAHPRAQFVVGHSPVLHAAYAEFMAPKETS
jgi:hypothetical protein